MSPKVKVILALAAMFVVGAISGAGLTLFLHPHFSKPPSAGEIQEHMQEFLTNRLHLTAEQQEAIKPITADFARQAEKFHAESVEQFSQLANTTDDRIAATLTPDQKIELTKMRQEREQDFARHGGPHMGP